MICQYYSNNVFKDTKSAGTLLNINFLKVMLVLLSFPFSTASVERIFSHLMLIKNDHSTALKHESLLALMQTENLFLKYNGSHQASCLMETVKRDYFPA